METRAICFDFQSTGECSRGKSCKFSHSSPQASGGQKAKMCKLFETTGSCSFGAKCKFQHNSKSKGSKNNSGKNGGDSKNRNTTNKSGGSGGPNQKNNTSKTPNEPRKASENRSHDRTQTSVVDSNANEMALFLKRLRFLEPAKISLQISQFSLLWLECWRNSQSLPNQLVDLLVLTLAKIPFSSQAIPPPIQECSTTLIGVIKATKKDEDSIAKQVETIISVIKRLLKFEWEIQKTTVQTSLSNVLSASSSSLDCKFANHRRLQTKINDIFEELEKPWTIRSKTESIENLVAVTVEGIFFLNKCKHRVS